MSIVTFFFFFFTYPHKSATVSPPPELQPSLLLSKPALMEQKHLSVKRYCCINSCCQRCSKLMSKCIRQLSALLMLPLTQEWWCEEQPAGGGELTGADTLKTPIYERRLEGQQRQKYTCRPKR